MSIPSVNGAVWTQSWTAPTDGPFTVLAKLIQANAWRPRDVARFLDFPAVRGAHVGGSLFHVQKPHRFDESCSSLHALVASHSLGPLVPRLAGDLVGESRFRYCPDCMKVGFQAATCQIDALVNCLIHDRPLLCNCQHCGAETPRYEVSKGVRLCCAHCGWSWCGKQLGESGQASWGKPDQVERFEALHRWLASLNEPEVVDWRNLNAWNVEDHAQYTRHSLQDDYYRERRVAVFDALRAVVPGAPVSTRQSNVCVLGPYAHDGTQGGRRAAKDSIPDDAIAGQLDMLPNDGERLFYRHFTMFSGDGGVPLPTDPVVPPEVHAKALWRAQVYAGPRLDQDFRLDDLGKAPPRLETWRLGQLLGVKEAWSWELNCDHALKVGVLTACKVAALRAANSWHEVLVRKGPCAPNELLQDFQAHRRTLSVWRRWDHFPIGFISVGARPLQPADKGSSEKVYLAVM